MKLLVVTQAVDTEDPVLGFFVRWIEEFAKRVEQVEVICLKEGKYDLPSNVRVHSLGKERGRPLFGSIAYAFRFLRLAWRLYRDYDTVFVHMNQEYILLGGWLWKLLSKRIFLWRNHYEGSWKTGLAVAFCNTVFCTSRHSYTARYKKTVLMPVGVDTGRFHPDARVARTPRSVLFLGRMAASKRPEMLVGALAELAERGEDFQATFVGSPLPRDASYYEGLKAQADLLLDERVTFLPGVPNGETPAFFRSHEVFVNCSPSGMLDKTLFEAAACSCRVLASSEDWRALAGEASYFNSSTPLAERLHAAFNGSAHPSLEAVVEKNSLTMLADQLVSIIDAA